jgi:predicted dehydrogenase
MGLSVSGERRFNGGPLSPKPLRIGLVGLGYWGPNLLRVLGDIEDVEVRWLCDLDELRLERWSRRYPGARATDDCAQLFDDPELDAVVIATPPFTHHELASRSLLAGKHTFVEKPLATTSADAEELQDIAFERNRVLMCGHTFVYSPPVREIGRLLDDGELGELFFISSSRVNLGLHQPDVSVIFDLGPHDFSILRYWLNEMPESISAIGRDSIVAGVPDVAFLTLRYPSGLLVNLEMSWLAPSKLRRTVLVGSDRMVVYEDGAAEPVRIFDHGVVYKDPESFGEYHLSYRTGDIVSPRIDTSEPLAIQLHDFVSSIRRGTAPPGHLDLCLDVVRLVEGAEASLRQGGVPVALDGVGAET